MNIHTLYNIYLKTNGVSTDTRNLPQGSMFFALRGDNFDGNRFAGTALDQGSSWCVVDDRSLERNEKFIFVDNTLEALQQLAAYHRKQLKIPVLAITGSNGKTTTKELALAVLGSRMKVNATKGNLNNHIGVPLTLLSEKDPEFLLVEMGANHQGEIAALCSIATPGYGIITNIGSAHLEGFGSPAGVRKAKGELFDFLRANGGKAFYNYNNDILRSMVEERNLSAIPFGNASDSLCSGEVLGRSRMLKVRLNFRNNKTIDVQSNLAGDYNLENILAAAAIGSYFGIPADEIKTAIENYIPSNSRSQFITTQKNRIILDAYNANPSSMEKSLLNFTDLEEEPEKVVILGDMLELGEYSGSEHHKILAMLVEKKIENAFLVGEAFMKAREQFKEYKFFSTADELASFLENNRIEDKLILLKGSRGTKLEKVLPLL